MSKKTKQLTVEVDICDFCEREFSINELYNICVCTICGKEGCVEHMRCIFYIEDIKHAHYEGGAYMCQECYEDAEKEEKGLKEKTELFHIISAIKKLMYGKDQRSNHNYELFKYIGDKISPH